MPNILFNLLYLSISNVIIAFLLCSFVFSHFCFDAVICHIIFWSTTGCIYDSGPVGYKGAENVLSPGDVAIPRSQSNALLTCSWGADVSTPTALPGV